MLLVFELTEQTEWKVLINFKMNLICGIIFNAAVVVCFDQVFPIFSSADFSFSRFIDKAHTKFNAINVKQNRRANRRAE